MKFIKKNWHRLAMLSFAFLLPLVSFAEDCKPDGGKICNPIGQNTVTGFVETVLKGAIRIGTPVIVLAIIYCGFLFVSAQGNSEKVTKAKDALLYTLIGAAILLGSLAIAETIKNTVTVLN